MGSVFLVYSPSSGTKHVGKSENLWDNLKFWGKWAIAYYFLSLKTREHARQIVVTPASVANARALGTNDKTTPNGAVAITLAPAV